MQKSVEDFFRDNCIQGLQMVSAKMMRMRIFEFSTPNIELRSNDYPLVDRTLGLIFLVNGGHKHLASALGRLHASKLNLHEFVEDGEFVHFFLRHHGYYWSGAHFSQSYAPVVTSRDFKFTDMDAMLGHTLGLDYSAKDYPFK